MLAYSCALHALSAREVSIFIWDAYFVCFACFITFVNCFLGVFDHGTVVNCRFCMQSDLFNGKQEIAKPIIKIFVFVLKLDFFLLEFRFLYTLIEFRNKVFDSPFFLPVSSSKVKKDLGG